MLLFFCYYLLPSLIIKVISRDVIIDLILDEQQECYKMIFDHEHTFNLKNCSQI